MACPKSQRVEGPERVCVDQNLGPRTFGPMTLVPSDGQGRSPQPTYRPRRRRGQFLPRNPGQTLLQRPHGVLLGNNPCFEMLPQTNLTCLSSSPEASQSSCCCPSLPKPCPSSHGLRPLLKTPLGGWRKRRRKNQPSQPGQQYRPGSTPKTGSREVQGLGNYPFSLETTRNRRANRPAIS